ncbi:Tubulin-specific chaperone C [Cryptosporidium felis]|nr:Tubulin-specific chaperone C [Cryptosporidium felis]
MQTENILNIKDEEIDFSEDQVSNVLKLDHIYNSRLRILSSLCRVDLSNTEKSTIYIGPVSTSITIGYCSDSTIIVTCKQMRVHHSHNLLICLNCCTPPLIECCTNITFDINSTVNSNFHKSFGYKLEESGFSNSEFLNQGSFRVLDLSWLRIQDSPNWRIGELT